MGVWDRSSYTKLSISQRKKKKIWEMCAIPRTLYELKIELKIDEANIFRLVDEMIKDGIIEIHEKGKFGCNGKYQTTYIRKGITINKW